MNKKITACILFLALAQLAIQAAWMLRETGFIVTRMTQDDTFYYLQTAWNFKNMGVATFDGLHRTNGLNILWFWITTFFAFLTSDKTVLLKMTLGFCALANAACYFSIWKLGEVLKRPFLALFAASSWFYFNIKIHYDMMLSMAGLENSLNAFVFWTLLWVTLLAREQISGWGKSKRNLMAMILLSAALVYLRLESVFYGAMLTSSVYFYFFREHSARPDFFRVFQFHFLTVGLLAGLCVLSYFIMGGTFLPISGKVKISTYHLTPSDIALVAMLTLTRILPIQLIKAAGFFPGHFPLAALTPIFAAGLVLFTSFFIRFCVLNPIWVRLRIFYLSLAAAAMAHLLFAAGMDPYFFWHHTLLAIFMVFSFALIMDFIFAKKAVPVSAAVLALMVFPAVVSASSFYHLPYQGSIYYVRLEVSRWISRNLPEKTILAAWNAGELGYFSGRRVVNLDGLINSVEFYKNVLKGGQDWFEYFRENKIEYLVDYEIQKYINRPMPLVMKFAPDAEKGVEIRKV